MNYITPGAFAEITPRPAPESPSAPVSHAYQYSRSNAHYHAHCTTHSFCHSCCHPKHACCCGDRHCRKECKELLTLPSISRDDNLSKEEIGALSGSMGSAKDFAALSKGANAGDAAVIGGGCCVHLSVEYMCIAGSKGRLRITVTDSAGTELGWSKLAVTAGYHIDEDIITTNAGAILKVKVDNVIARVRWCEVFAC